MDGKPELIVLPEYKYSPKTGSTHYVINCVRHIENSNGSK
jgi:hypothetical protein